jgi:hypothetical protein
MIVVEIVIYARKACSTKKYPTPMKEQGLIISSDHATI